MTFRFDNILENWAIMYKPLRHSRKRGSKNKRFYRIKTISTENEFVRNKNSVKSPCMLYSVMIDAKSEGNKAINYRYEIYFMSKSETKSLAKTAKQDEDLGTDQQLAMDGMVQDLLAYLHKIKSTGICPITKQPFDRPTVEALRGLQLDKAEWASLPVMFQEWHVMGLSIDNITPRNLCIQENNYEIQPLEE